MPDPTARPLQGIAIYNPKLLGREELIGDFVARGRLLNRLVDDIRRVPEGGSPQHHLLLGQRGMGKTTLLHRLRYAIEDDDDLAARWLPLVFPEEQYNVNRLSSLWLNCIDALLDTLEETGAEAAALDRAVSDLQVLPEQQRQRQALALLLATAAAQERRLVLLIDNLDLVLDRLKDEHWTLREILSSQNELLVVGASSRAIEATYTYEAAFYDFFRIHELRKLTIEEMNRVLLRLAERRNTPHVEALVRGHPERARPLQELTGGNPRTVVLLYEVLARGPDGDVRSDLEQLLDRCTPLYKARFESLPTQAQTVVDALALHWHPLTAGGLAARTQLDNRAVSTQLDRLSRQGVVEKVAYVDLETRKPSRRSGYQISERFFNVWYLMRASRRMRRRLVWLVEFLRLVHTPEEIRELARRQLRYEAINREHQRHAEYSLALALAVEDTELRHALEHSGLQTILDDPKLRRHMRELVDLGGDDADLQPLAVRLQRLAAIKKQVLTAEADWREVDPAEFWDLLGGALSLNLRMKETIASRLEHQTHQRIARMTDLLRQERDSVRTILRDVVLAEACHRAVRRGLITELGNEDELDAAAFALDCPHLRALVVLLLGQGSPVEDERRLRWALQTTPGLPVVWAKLGVLLGTAMGRPLEAEEALVKAISLDPDFGPTWVELGVVKADYLHRPEEAKVLYEKAIQLSPDFYGAWNSLGWLVYKTGGDIHAAEESARKAVSLAPENLYSAHTLATILIHTGRWAEASTHAKRFIEEGHPKFHEAIWPHIITFFREATHAGHGADAALLLDECNVGVRWLPLREALAAAGRGSVEGLKALAPEIRAPAETLYAELSAPFT